MQAGPRTRTLSINELARQLGRNYKNVHTGVSRLIELGLVEPPGRSAGGDFVGRRDGRDGLAARGASLLNWCTTQYAIYVSQTRSAILEMRKVDMQAKSLRLTQILRFRQDTFSRIISKVDPVHPRSCAGVIPSSYDWTKEPGQVRWCYASRVIL